MREIGDEYYYTTQEVAYYINRTYQTVYLWDRRSRELELDGKQRLIPKPMYWGEGRKSNFGLKNNWRKLWNFKNSIVMEIYLPLYS